MNIGTEKLTKQKLIKNKRMIKINFIFIIRGNKFIKIWKHINIFE